MTPTFRPPWRSISRARSSSASASTSQRHPLRRELLVTMITNDVVNSMGMTFVQRMVAETGATAPDAARAFLVARDVSDARFRWDDIETLDGVIDGGVQTALMDGVDGMVEQLTRWYLRNPVGPRIWRRRSSVTGTGSARSSRACASAGPEGWRVLHDERLHELEEARVPERAAALRCRRSRAGICAGHPDGRPQLRPLASPRSPTRSLPSVSGCSWTRPSSASASCRAPAGGSGWPTRR